jgi:hypothetical protein
MESFPDLLRGLLGIAVFVGVAVLFSSNRRNIPWRVVAVGILLQFVLAAMVVHLSIVRMAVEAVGLVKMDILAQGGLAAMRDVTRWLQARGITLDLDRCVACAAQTFDWQVGVV